MSARLEAGGWRLETGDWRLETGDWRLETGDWRLEAAETIFRQRGVLRRFAGAVGAADRGNLRENVPRPRFGRRAYRRFGECSPGIGCNLRNAIDL
jgi:hypothetical protein